MPPQVVYQEFVRWFDARTVGLPERYTELAAEILAMLEDGGAI